MCCVDTEKPLNDILMGIYGSFEFLFGKILSANFLTVELMTLLRFMNIEACELM